MLGAIFGFRGRINRLHYFLGSVGAAIALVAIAIVALGVGLGPAMSRYAAHDPQAFSGLGASLGPAALVLLVAIVLYVWVALSLQARRFRDIGWEPAVVIPAWLIGGAVIQAMALAAGHSGGVLSLLASLVNFALACCLLFVPGRDTGAPDLAAPLRTEPPTGGDRPVAPARAKPAAPKPTWAPAPPSRVTWAPAQGQSGFGRRGL